MVSNKMYKHKIRNNVEYFDHGCTIVPDKDVLDLDIKGKTLFTIMTKWWYDLFLLSYSDERSRQYFLSLNSMNVERARQFRYYKKAIHPFSKFRKFWDCIIFNIVFINLVFFLQVSVVYTNLLVPVPLYYAISFSKLLLFINIFINSRTGYVNNETKTVVLNATKILIQYFSTKLFLHSASAIPLETLLLMRYGSNLSCGHCKSNKFVITLRFLSIFGVLHLHDMSRNWARGSTFGTMYFLRFTRIILLSFVLILYIIHAFDTLGILFIIMHDKVNQHCLYYILLKDTYVLKFTSYDISAVMFSRVCSAVVFVGNELLTESHECSLDVLCAMVTFLVAIILYIWTFLECHAYLSRMTYTKDQLSLANSTAANMLRCRQLPDAITAKVASYFKFNMTKLIITQKQNPLYGSLPKNIVREIKVSCYSKYIRRMPFFSSWPTERTDEIVLMLKEEVHLRNDIVSNMWTQGDGLVLLIAGVMAVYSADGKEVGHLIDGDYFGEQSLVTDKEIGASTVVAVTNCMILILDNAEFRKHMRSHLQLFFKMKQYLKKYRNENGDPKPNLIQEEVNAET